MSAALHHDMGLKPSKTGKQNISITGLLHWAFARECARVDFDELANSSGGQRVGTDTIWRMMQAKRLGCRPDGGGHSDPHPDADIVASAVSYLPDHVGGKRMALVIQELAINNEVPYWYQDEIPRIFPTDTHTNKHGVRAVKGDAAQLGSEGWPNYNRRNRKGNLVKEKVEYCPVVVRPSVDQIARARRAYLSWWGAMLELQSTFQMYDNLSCWVVNDDMPALTPWEKSS